MVSVEAIMITSITNYSEGTDVVVYDITYDFLITEID